MHGMEEIDIRYGKPQDAEILAGFNISLADETERLKLDRSIVLSGVRDLMASPEHGFYLVAESGQEISGMLMVTSEWSDWRDGIYWWIQSLYVKPKFRRKGVFRALYDRVKDMASSRGGICGLRVYVDKRNAKARETYERLGMNKTGYEVYEHLFAYNDSPGGHRKGS